MAAAAEERRKEEELKLETERLEAERLEAERKEALAPAPHRLQRHRVWPHSQIRTRRALLRLAKALGCKQTISDITPKCHY